MAQAITKASVEYSLEVYKSERLLLLKENNLLKRSYKIAVGSGGEGDKFKTGDNVTPVGVYRIINFKENSRFHFFMQLNYPNTKDALHGLEKTIIQKPEFDRIIQQLKAQKVPDQRTLLGGSIGIHGIGLETRERMTVHQQENWTQGCIALTNEEIEELKAFVKIGTRVIIFH
jgi:murein L,D-transpeptidase YafK